MKEYINNLLILGSSGNIGSEIIHILSNSPESYNFDSIHLIDIDHSNNVAQSPVFSFHTLDVRDPSHISKLVDILEGLPNVAVLNLIALDYTSSSTSMQTLGSFSPTVDEFMNVLSLNVAFPYSLAKNISSRKLCGVRLVHIGSIYGLRMPRPSLYDDSGECVKPAPYAVSKSALISLVKYSAYELSRSNSECFMITLGGVDSPSHSDDFRYNYKKLTEGFGLLKHSKTASTILDIITSLPFNMANGSNLVLDNGYTVF